MAEKRFIARRITESDKVRSRAQKIGVTYVRAAAPEPPTPKRDRKREALKRQPTKTVKDDVLAELVRAAERDMPVDATELVASQRRALYALRRLKLAKPLGDGLWALTLAGVAKAREGRRDAA